MTDQTEVTKAIRCNILDYGYHAYTGGPCCYTREKFRTRSYDQLKAHPYYIEIKQTMDSGKWHRACQYCQNAESLQNQKILSKRQLWLEDFNEISDKPRGLTFLSMDTGKLCNLSCRTCGPWSSTSWVNEWPDLNYVFTGDPNKKHPVLSVDFDIDSHDFKDLRFLELLGGEPFYNLNCYGVLEKAIKESQGQCRISIVTNGTIFPDVDRYPWFKDNLNIHITVSVDAIGKPAEFIRTGTNWEKVDRNIKKFKDLGVSLSFHFTHSIFNLFELDRVEDWRISQGLPSQLEVTVASTPDYVSFSVLTDQEKDKICEYLSARHGEYLIPYIKPATFDPHSRKRFFEFMSHTHRYHGLDWQEYFPDLYRLLSGLDFT